MASTTPKAAATMETHAVDASGSRKLAASTTTAAAATSSHPNIKVVVVGFWYFIYFKSLGNLLFIKFVFSS